MAGSIVPGSTVRFCIKFVVLAMIIFLAGLILREISAVAKCSNASFIDSTLNSWYDNLNYCARFKHDNSPNSLYTASTLSECVSSRPTDESADYPHQNAALVSMLNGPTDCPACIVAYANSLVSMYVSNSDFEESCGSSSKSTSRDTSFDSAKCVRHMYSVLNVFNTCSGLPLDLRTSTTSTRCTYEDFYTWEAKFRPLGPYLFDSVSSSMANNVPVSCSSCLESFSPDLSEECPDIDSIDAACLASVETDLDALEVCTGGSGFRREIWEGESCSETDVLFLETYRPYEAYVACASNVTFNACVNDLGFRVPELEEFDCANCLTKFVTESALDECVDDPFDPLCITELTGPWNPIDNLFYCTNQVRLSTVQTQCVEILDSVSLSFVPIVEAVLASKTIQNSMQVADNSFSCKACFNRLAADIFQSVQSSNLIGLICGPNPYSVDCASSLTKELIAFEKCSGQAATSVSPYQCEIGNASAFAESILVSGGDWSPIEAPCSHCFATIAEAIGDLNLLNLAACRADLDSIECKFALGNELRAFRACAGFDFGSNANMTTTTTTTQISTTTTNISTTSKSCSIGLLIFPILLYIN